MVCVGTVDFDLRFEIGCTVLCKRKVAVGSTVVCVPKLTKWDLIYNYDLETILCAGFGRSLLMPQNKEYERTVCFTHDFLFFLLLFYLFIFLAKEIHMVHKQTAAEFRSRVKVKVAVLGSPSLVVLLVSVDVKQH